MFKCYLPRIIVTTSTSHVIFLLNALRSFCCFCLCCRCCFFFFFVAVLIETRELADVDVRSVINSRLFLAKETTLQWLAITFVHSNSHTKRELIRYSECQTLLFFLNFLLYHSTLTLTLTLNLFLLF